MQRFFVWQNERFLCSGRLKWPPRQRLGGYALLPRMLDKGRAKIAGTSGEYHYNCPLDQPILNFLGLDPGALREQLATGKGDGEILQWISENAQHKHAPWEIEQWSDYQRNGWRADEDSRRYQGLARPARPRRLREFRRQIISRLSTRADWYARWDK
ncbi:MAG TPA: DUF5069 domain-containing protein [Chthoniobacterales bacterium]|nr:DUF5069 domain-containing protein [Chthoniobacterales bacterium]